MLLLYVSGLLHKNIVNDLWYLIYPGDRNNIKILNRDFTYVRSLFFVGGNVYDNG